MTVLSEIGDKTFFAAAVSFLLTSFNFTNELNNYSTFFIFKYFYRE